MRILLNKIASVTRNLKLNREATLSASIQAHEGAVVVGRVLNEKSVYNQLEDVHGRMSSLHPGNVVAGALGRRNALHGYEGVLPSKVEPGQKLQILNLGGVIGECVSHNPKVGRPFDIEILGQLLLFPRFRSREGEPANVSMGALQPAAVELTCPIVCVAGTCMNSGKTLAASVLIRHFKAAGYRVGGAKLTGVSLLKDKLSMLDYGAERAYDFTDAGCVISSTETAPRVARTLFAALQEEHCDVIIAEMGDGIMGEYGVQAILEDPELGKLPAAFVLCANDPVGCYGGVELLRNRFGIEVDVVAGPATDNNVGTRFVKTQLGLPAWNAQTHAPELAQLIFDKVAPRLGKPA